jgi:16S rRNA (adenine1518-N6/adenine1519-N6)-dimethyltransferase
VPAPLTPASIRSLLDEHGVTPSRALGQNFLADPNTASRIVRLAEITPGERVVEVGPGLGSLTVALCAAGASVVAVELDRHVVRALESVVAGLPVRLVVADALHVDWREVLGDDDEPDRDAGWTMVANLPYNVAARLVVRCLEDAPMIDRFLVMVQREVGERLAAAPGSRTYGGVSVRVAYYAEAQVVGIVPPTVFMPRPNVESALVRLVRRPHPTVDVPDVERMFTIVRAGFATRRKTLRRALASTLGDRAAVVLQHAGVDPGARAETLALEQWAAIARAETEMATGTETA